MQLIKINYLLALFIVSFSGLYSQETLLINGASGKAYIYKKISPDQARKDAIDEAKIDALKKAGVSENIESHQVLLTSQSNLSLKQLFTSNIMSEIHGVVQSFSIVSEEMTCVDQNQIVYKIILNASVRKYISQADPAFQISIEGLSGSYKSGERMTFDFKSTKDGYLTIFNINETDTTILFPLKTTDENKMYAGKSYSFPNNKYINYVMETSKSAENNQLLFVCTKEDYRYNNYGQDYKTSFADVKSWLYSIEPMYRAINFQSFIISK